MAAIFKEEAVTQLFPALKDTDSWKLHFGALLPDAEGRPTNFALLALGFPHGAAALTEWRDAAWPMMKDGSRVSTTPTAQLIGLWAHYVLPRERKIAKYPL